MQGLEVYADISCPFAHVSLRRLKPVRDRISPRTPCVVRAWPLELVNGAPLDPVVTATHIAELRRDVAPDLFSRSERMRMPHTTLNALALVEAANDADPWLGESLSLDLRTALFEEGRRIDEELLAELAREHGLEASIIEDVGRVDARYAEGRRRGVMGSPHYFIGESGLFCPLLDIEKDAVGTLRVRERLERLENFVRQGLGPRAPAQVSSTAQNVAGLEAHP